MLKALRPCYGGARQRDGRKADRLPEVARGEDGRPLRLRTTEIRCDRPTVQGPPAISPAQWSRAGCQPILPQRTISCDAKDHARPRKYLEQNTFSKRGVQVESRSRSSTYGRTDPSAAEAALSNPASKYSLSKSYRLSALDRDLNRIYNADTQ